MRITTITVSYGQTQSLPEYSNVKPHLSITAEIGPEDDPTQIETDLWIWARDSVHELIDQALEGSGRAARYSKDPRYQVVTTHRDPYKRQPDLRELLAILPDSVDARAVGDLVHGIYPESRGMRLAHAQRAAAEYVRDHPRFDLVDCSSGDLAPLTALLAAPPAERPDLATPLPDDDLPEDITPDDDDYSDAAAEQSMGSYNGRTDLDRN